MKDSRDFGTYVHAQDDEGEDDEIDDVIRLLVKTIKVMKTLLFSLPHSLQVAWEDNVAVRLIPSSSLQQLIG